MSTPVDDPGKIATLAGILGKCAAALGPLTEHPARVGIFRAEDRARIDAAVAALSGAPVEDPMDATIRDLRALLGRCATVLDRCLVEWCAGCGRKRTTPGPCPHCSADGRNVSTTADAPDHLHCLGAELRAAGVEPTP